MSNSQSLFFMTLLCVVLLVLVSLSWHIFKNCGIIFDYHVQLILGQSLRSFCIVDSYWNSYASKLVNLLYLSADVLCFVRWGSCIAAVLSGASPRICFKKCSLLSPIVFSLNVSGFSGLFTWCKYSKYSLKVFPFYFIREIRFTYSR